MVHIVTLSKIIKKSSYGSYPASWLLRMLTRALYKVHRVAKVYAILIAEKLQSV